MGGLYHRLGQRVDAFNPGAHLSILSSKAKYLPNRKRMDQLMPFLSSVCRGGVWGMLMGGGLGTLTGIVAIHRTDPPKTLAFQHPLSGNVVELDTYELDEQHWLLVDRGCHSSARPCRLCPSGLIASVVAPG